MVSGVRAQGADLLKEWKVGPRPPGGLRAAAAKGAGQGTWKLNAWQGRQRFSEAACSW